VSGTPAGGAARSSQERLSLIVLTAGPLSAINRVFFERLARDPLLRIEAILVDGYARPRRPLAARIFRGVRAEGWRWLGFKIATAAGALVRRAGLRLFDRLHPPHDPGDPYAALERRAGVPVHRVADLHDAASLALLRSLRPRLGVIVGGRILRDTVTTIPALGTLNLHKRRVPEHRGGGPVGYWEILGGERSIGVTVHYATAEVDAGPVVAEETIPIEECDTLESLRIKADLVGARLYHEAIRRVASGERGGTPQDAARGVTHRAPSDLEVWRLERRLRRAAAARMPALRARPSRLVRGRVLLQYAIVLPLLLGLRRRLIARRRAPVCILFYHLVANRPLNHLCLPLESFARQMEFLGRYYEIVSLDEAVTRLGSGTNDAIAAAITFDDGYRDNGWAIAYLQFFGIPAAFFVSAGHVSDGSRFEHDLRRGHADALPMDRAQVRGLAADGFLIASHGVHHEDFGTLDPAAAERVLRESRALVADLAGRDPAHFSFPKGQRGVNITRASLSTAEGIFRFVYSAYGGYNFPRPGARHFHRVAHPGSVPDLALVMDGYTGLRRCLGGNAWELKSDALPPYAPERPGRVRRAPAAQGGTA
jgi:peptidoglycan/xylan/chitin deacetylase (PgdA/CDA1 family)/folate-dependent phosphoribosylglycinamide formyltransferase PurN